MALLDQIQKDMVAAMKAREELKLGALRSIKTALKKAEVDGSGKLDEKAEMQVLQRLVKQRAESAEMFHKGDRTELAEKEEAEQKLIEAYLPASASEAEMEAAVAAVIAEVGASSMKDMGPVMKAAQAALQGKTIDGKTLSGMVRAKLG